MRAATGREGHGMPDKIFCTLQELVWHTGTWTDHRASPEIVQPLTLELRPIPENVSSPIIAAADRCGADARRSFRQSRNRPPPDIVAPRNFALCFLAGVEALDRLAPLVIGEVRPAAKPDAVRHGTGAASQSNRNCSPGSAGGRNKSQCNGTRLRPSPSLAAAASNLRPIIQA
jgi:hypothetical protein